MKARGFTLVELLVTIALMGLMGVICWRGLDYVVAQRGEVDALRFDDTAQGRRLAATPRHAADVARGLPAAHEVAHALFIGEPSAAARGPVRVRRQRRGADRDEIVDGHRDRVPPPAAALVGSKDRDAQPVDARSEQREQRG